ncbi:type VI secretion system baseplate subunit TssF [Rhizobium laguerreae]|uniref:type VI secretion system baseplate subunit TssF n=1 Tax=Rhizobium laguerreae TaxID=1076926 RepID=UPI001C90D86D|nr:type VI secretion system baseplate subunit TssF [Rhizobium laguerreae]MBY3347984.1 type VI secretion system baseplate subunit TssF [Rhizobium laguerreae]MBY3354947.1 type VI secretion system baseplate subunit TssF [Rhizobium laguerreae]MBY3376252.1 type VI secretion system baseplate subunit TssF [Rhizobium laguerreae]MBY3431251.1 type VI secretion system baseplate subunit TssF [Rhizobium laguerreae]MBY3439867.1 type VI secretion system baseplate subunit TssF [Rhizobium laguerreae]
MNREFLEFYDRELKILYERSKEFAAEFPGAAKRLGPLIEEKIDPAIGGLLEGAAFMAARVQLKLKSEFDTFTNELIEQLLPGFLAPTPSFAVVEARPNYGNPDLVAGERLKAGQFIETTFTEQDRRVACRYKLTTDLTLWPYKVGAVKYHASAAPLQALGFDCDEKTVAGLQIELTLNNDKSPLGKQRVSKSAADHLTFHLVGPTSDAVSLYEQLFARLERVAIRYLDPSGDPRFILLDRACIEPIGFGSGESLFAHEDRVFAGFNHLREYFAFPAKYLGFRLCGLARHLSRIDAASFELVFAFSNAVPRLGSITNSSWFVLYGAPVTNLFEIVCSPIPVRNSEHEFAVIGDRSRPLDYEIYRVVSVRAQMPRNKDAVPVYGLYSAPSDNIPLPNALFYATRRTERRKTDKERRFGMRSAYLGSETFLSLSEPAAGVEGEHVRSLNVRALVTNRHLTDQLPVRPGGSDFVLVDDAAIQFDCVAGPTPPRESLLAGEHRSRGAEKTGSILWKLISLLQFNHLGLDPGTARSRSTALQELLMIFADASNPIIERQIRGLSDISVKPTVRKVKQPDRYDVARGLEVNVTLDENAFEGQGAFLFGVVLARFFTEYAALNTFVETVIISKQRGVLKRWEPQIGGRAIL